MHHIIEHINQDIARRLSKDKDSTVNKTEYLSKRNPTGKPRWAGHHLILSSCIYNISINLNKTFLNQTTTLYFITVCATVKTVTPSLLWMIRYTDVAEPTALGNSALGHQEHLGDIGFKYCRIRKDTMQVPGTR